VKRIYENKRMQSGEYEISMKLKKEINRSYMLEEV
jgi:hypothetical protein